jgi:hypothetical protein
MDSPYAVGSLVRQKVVPLQGKILDTQFDAKSRTFRYLVAVGQGDVRWLDHASIEEVPA